jgi:hypothetical protein
MEEQKQNLEVGQILYACGYKIKKVSFSYDLIVGLKIMKIKLLKITKKYIVRDGWRVSKNSIGKYIFLTEKGIIDFIIREEEARIEEKLNSKRKQYLDNSHLEAIRKDLKKWRKVKKLNSEKDNNNCEDKHILFPRSKDSGIMSNCISI